MEKYLRFLLLIFVLVSVILFYRQGGSEYLSLGRIQARLDYLDGIYDENPFRVLILIFAGIVVLASLSIPGSIVLTLLTGTFIGPFAGALLVCAATTTGAVIAFLFARFVLRDFVARKFHLQYELFQLRISEEGKRYLFALRLFPASPYVVVNLMMGTTQMRTSTFAWITFVGMFPGTYIYVFAGKKIAELESVSGVLSPLIIITLVALSLLPYAWQFILKRIILRAKNKECLMPNEHHHRNSLYSISGVEFEGEDMARLKAHHGPRDEKIKAEAIERLRSHSILSTHDIHVEVEDGTIFLKGGVTDTSLKGLAHDCISGIKGVSEIVNQLWLVDR